MKTKIYITGIILSIIYLIGLLINGIIFNANCTGYLKRAASANTVEMAINDLEKAINYMEEHNLTNGYTSVLYKTPDDDISFWYNNIKNAYEELKALPDDPVATSNALMKLRETLLDDTKDGVKVTRPEGIAKYPYNGILFVFTTIFVIWLIFGWAYLNAKYN